MILGQIGFVQEWRWNLDPESEHEPVWLRMPHFPVGLWTKRNILGCPINRAAGTPLSLDPSTRDRSRIFYARVRVDLAAPLPKGIWLEYKGERIWQSLKKYPLLLKGHTQRKCSSPSSKPEQNKESEEDPMISQKPPVEVDQPGSSERSKPLC